MDNEMDELEFLTRIGEALMDRHEDPHAALDRIQDAYHRRMELRISTSHAPLFFEVP